MPEPEGHLSQSTQRSSVKAGSKTISHKKAQGSQKAKHQHFAYFVPFCGKYLILL